MRILATVFTAIVIAACGSQDDEETALAAGGSNSDVTFCSCVNEPITTDAKAAACGKLIDAIAPEQTAAKTVACRQQIPVPEGGPDLCFCLRSSPRDLETVQACEALIPKDITPRQLSAKVVECAQ